MKLNIGLFGSYYPSWLNNDELPEGERIKIDYKRITGAMSNDLVRFGMDHSMIFDNVAIVRKCVKKIYNLQGMDGEEITTAEALLNAVGVSGLVTEIGSHILTDSQMTEDLEKKNKEKPSLVS